MASSGLLIKSVSAMLLCMVLAAYVAEADVTCGTVTGSLSPCLAYATGLVSTPPSECCSGIQSLNDAAKTTPDRQTVCKCLKSISSTMSGINYVAVEGLPAKCGVNIPYKISPSTDCNSVQ